MQGRINKGRSMNEDLKHKILARLMEIMLNIAINVISGMIVYWLCN